MNSFANGPTARLLSALQGLGTVASIALPVPSRGATAHLGPVGVGARSRIALDRLRETPHQLSFSRVVARQLDRRAEFGSSLRVSTRPRQELRARGNERGVAG